MLSVDFGESGLLTSTDWANLTEAISDASQSGAVSDEIAYQLIAIQARFAHRQFQTWEAHKAAHGTYPGE